MDNINFDFCFKCNWRAGETHPAQKFTPIPEGAEVGRKPARARKGGEQPGGEKDTSEQEGSAASDGRSGEERGDEEKRDEDGKSASSIDT